MVQWRSYMTFYKDNFGAVISISMVRYMWGFCQCDLVFLRVRLACGLKLDMIWSFIFVRIWWLGAKLASKQGRHYHWRSRKFQCNTVHFSVFKWEIINLVGSCAPASFNVASPLMVILFFIWLGGSCLVGWMRRKTMVY